GRRIYEEDVANERVSSDTEEVRLDEEEVAAERASEDTEEMATVLTTMDAATVLAIGVAEVPTGSGSIPTAGPPAAEVHTEGQRAYWKITRLGGSSASYQFFIDLLKHLDRDDLNQLWSLVKESLSNRPPTSDKERELLSASTDLKGQRYFYACREGLPSKEGFGTCDDLLQASSGEQFADGRKFSSKDIQHYKFSKTAK
nr:hypothetical protein [Tanacetum cinerariifolium]